jgi:hypothetical protein
MFRAAIWSVPRAQTHSCDSFFRNLGEVHPAVAGGAGAKDASRTQEGSDLLEPVDLTLQCLQPRLINITINNRDWPTVSCRRGAQFFITCNQFFIREKNNVLTQPPPNTRIIPNYAANDVEWLKAMSSETLTSSKITSPMSTRVLIFGGRRERSPRNPGVLICLH